MRMGWGEWQGGKVVGVGGQAGEVMKLGRVFGMV